MDRKLAQYSVTTASAQPNQATGEVTYYAVDGTPRDVSRTFHGREAYSLACLWGESLAGRFNAAATEGR